ncbi:MAG: hypothetical protein D6701_00705 [Gemmatimonadetes bacterium]|nr:MAG: hypothetical protein D6701_00705 [Gemmatimonadota bacterium]
MTLVDDAFVTVARATTDGEGRFTLTLPDPGSYSIVVEGEGFASLTHGPWVLAPGDTLRTTLDARRLTPIEEVEAAAREHLLRQRAARLAERLPPGLVKGRVVDEAGRPVETAEVRLDAGTGADQVAVTDREGRFLFQEVPAGSWHVTVSHLTYLTLEGDLEVRPGRGHEVQATMAIDALPIEGVTVKVRSRNWMENQRGIAERRRIGIGEFIDGEEIERRGQFSLAELLRGRPGVRVFGPGIRPESLQLRRCTPMVFKDGVPFDMALGFGEPILFDVELVEVYRGPSELPPEFNTGRNNCAIAFWTKRGT